MIVKNNNYYQGLFQKINEALNYSEDDKILHIEDYYTALEDIKAYVIGEGGTVENPKNDPYFLIMPVESDEYLFKIDANSRNIEIPEDFRKNGVAVQGDDRAEILYFSIDRYFDLTDLYHKEIFILWNPPGKDGKPVSDGTMISPVINKSLHYKENYVVFGWPIVKEMTEYPGDMEFSIRFYDRDEKDSKKLTYSFSTKPFKVKILPCKINDLDISNLESLDAAIINRNQEIYDSLRRTEVAGPGGQAAEPVWDLPAFKPQPEHSYHIDDLDEGVLRGRAKFADKEDVSKIGLISYSWSKSDVPKTSTSKNLVNNLTEILEYKDVTETETARDLYDLYYTLKEGEYTPYAGVIPPVEENVRIYKAVTSHKPEGPGYYYLTATNKLSRKAQKSVTYEDCWHIPKPEQPVTQYMLDEEVVDHIVFDSTTVPSKLLTLNVTTSDNGNIAIQWQYKEKASDKQFVALDGSTNNTCTINNYGYYSAIVSNTKNKATVSIETPVIRVSDFAKAVTVTNFLIGTKSHSADEFNEEESEVLTSASDITINLDMDNLPPYDSIEYRWEKLVTNEETQTQEWILHASSGALADNINSYKYHIGTSGTYRVLIINTYNKDVKTLIGPKFAFAG